jgi:GT2 family glycosyltransferase
MQEDQPFISVVISTRNRGASVVTTIESVLKNEYPYFDLHIIDQSDNFQTEEAIQPYTNNPRFFYTHSKTVGLGKGRNVGVNQSKHEYIAITDDDCEVPANWLQEMVKALTVNPAIGVVFGSVLPGKHDDSAGFIPTYNCKAPILARHIKQKNAVRGIGACMGIKRSIWREVKGFDEMLGPGAPFCCNDDGDFAIKVLLAGYYVYETPALFVIHHGFRTWKEGRPLARRNWYGVGASFTKHLKNGHFSLLKIICYEWCVIILGNVIHNVIVKHRISGVTPLFAFIKGLVVGLLSPVDRESGNFCQLTLKTKRLW